MKKSKVLVLHCAPMVRLGVASLLRARPDLTLVGEGCDTCMARELFLRVQPDVVILDLTLDHGDGIELIKDLRKVLPHTRAVVFTSRDDALSVQRAFKAGARGYLLANDDASEIIRALGAILEGDFYTSTRLSGRLVQSFISPRRNRETPGRSAAGLSDRELQILRLISGGYGPSRLAAELHVSVKTIETHRNRIKTKLGLRTGAELNAQALFWLESAPPDRNGKPGARAVVRPVKRVNGAPVIAV